MTKKQRVELKRKKRFLKLLYRKGILQKYDIDLADLGWDFLLNNKHLDIIIYSTNYWGEGEENSLIHDVMFSYFLDSCYMSKGEKINDFLDGRIGSLSDIKFFKELKKLPNVVDSSAINKVLKTNYNPV